MPKRIDQSTKKQVVVETKLGYGVDEIAERYQISAGSVYRWVNMFGDDPDVNQTAIAILRKENRQLRQQFPHFR
jgi:transposase